MNGCENTLMRTQEVLNPLGFSSLLRPGDFIYLVEKDGELVLDQIPDVQSSILSYHPKTGAVIAYVGGPPVLLKLNLIEFDNHFSNWICF